MSPTIWDASRVYCLIWGVKVVTSAKSKSTLAGSWFAACGIAFAGRHANAKRLLSAVAPVLLCLMTGCASFGGFTPPWKKADAKIESPRQEVVLASLGGLQPVVIDDATRQEFDNARKLFDEKKYAQAEPMFHKLVKLKTEPELVDDWPSRARE